jgi:hypothetical protein
MDGFAAHPMDGFYAHAVRGRFAVWLSLWPDQLRLISLLLGAPDYVNGSAYNRGPSFVDVEDSAGRYMLMAKRSAFQAEDKGSSPFTCILVGLGGVLDTPPPPWGPANSVTRAPQILDHHADSYISVRLIRQYSLNICHYDHCG